MRYNSSFQYATGLFQLVRVEKLSLVHKRRSLLINVIVLIAAACSEPPSQQNNKGPFPVNAVIAVAEQGAIQESLFLVGNLASRESIEIRSEIEAKITYIGFEEGASVNNGQVLFRLDDHKLEAQTAEAKARYEMAKNDDERGKSLLAKKTISVQRYDKFRFEMDAAKAALQLSKMRRADAVITASFAGRMDERKVSLGQFVNIGELLSTLIQTNPLEVEFNVPERYLGQLKTGQQIRITSVAYQGEAFEGEVFFISPQLDEQNRTVLMKANIDNSDGRLKPGMFANLELLFRATEDALIIPEQAISYQGDQASVVVMNSEDKAEFRDVAVGVRMSGQAEIQQGLIAGERIVVEGFQKMSPGTPIMISPKSEKYGISVSEL
ncbi:MAG: membrane fusion protein (multidrug efflux system) [Planctomycetota bacterium]|jgi:membrane fusion protein (multidrug efflux system)